MPVIKIKGVKAYVSNGKTYAYHRKSATPLLNTYGSVEFFAELAAVERKYQAKKQASETDNQPGTWRSRF